MAKAIEEINKEFGLDNDASFSEGKRRQFNRVVTTIISTIAIFWSSYHLYTTFFGTPNALIHRSIHLTFALSLIFILIPPLKRFKNNRFALAIDTLIVLLSLSIGIYVYMNADYLVNRAGMPILSDYIFGFIAIILVLEATRRVMGIALPLVAISLLAYAYFGEHLPRVLSHPGNDLSDITSFIFLSLNGIYGIAIGISATLLVIFILLSYFLIASGAGKFFMDLATSLIGWVRGGPAKMAVISSGFFGSITGSPAANVVSTGAVTIPLMKSLGYKPRFAGGVEAAASTGGQFMPPVMGAAAFVMADTIGIPYSQVVIAAVIPAFLYFLALLVMVDLEAAKDKLVGIPRKHLEPLLKIIKEGWFHSIPLLLLIYLLLVVGYSPARSGLYAIAAIVIINLFNKKNRMKIKDYLKVLEKGAIGTMEIAIACACAGIIIGSFALTGLGPRISSILLEFSQGYMLPLLILTMIASIIMGMALPTIVTYMVLSVLVAPTLIEMGVVPIAAHMFVLFFGVVSFVTPPIAFAAFAGAAIAGSDPMKTAITSSRLAICSFILPFMFVYNPELLLVGTGLNLWLAILSALIGIISISMAVQGYIFKELNAIKRILLFVTGLILVQANVMTDLIGYVVFFTIVFLEFSRSKTQQIDRKQSV